MYFMFGTFYIIVVTYPYTDFYVDLGIKYLNMDNYQLSAQLKKQINSRHGPGHRRKDAGDFPVTRLKTVLK